MSVESLIQAMNITDQDGVKYANPLKDDRYKVRYFELPPEGDLRADLKLLESFERRFFHSVGGGAEWALGADDPDALIAKQREMFKTATGGEKELAGSTLCVMLLERGLKRAKKHIRKRISGVPADDEALKAMSKLVEADLIEAINYIQYVRRKRGHPDVDDVLGEMKGEPYKIFVGTMPGNHGVMVHFQLNRLQKAAQAMRCMDAMAEQAKLLAVQHPATAPMAALIETLAEQAKQRVQLPVSAEEFDDAHRKLIVARNELHGFAPKTQVGAALPASLPGNHPLKSEPSATAVAMIKEAADIMYDMALIRLERPTTLKDFKKRVEEQVGVQQQRFRTTA